MVLPSSISSTTSSFTAPRSWRTTTPSRQLRAEVRSSPSPTARMTKLDLISARAGRPGWRSRFWTLSRVITAMIRTLSEICSWTSEFTAPGLISATTPRRAFRALVFMLKLQVS